MGNPRACSCSAADIHEANSSQQPAASSQSSQGIIWSDEGINNEIVCVANNEPKRDRNQSKKYMDSEGAVFTHAFNTLSSQRVLGLQVP
jgi:hypothetical protein